MKRVLATLGSAALVVGLSITSAVAPASAAQTRDHGWHWGWGHRDELTGGYTSVALNAATIAAVEGLGLTPAAIAPGTLNASAPSASFPIVGSMRDGIIRHVGGLSLSTKTTTLSLRHFDINTTTGVLTAFASVNGSAVGRINLFDLGAAPAQAGCAATASLSLDSAAAGALTKVFNAPDLTGANFGVACVIPHPGFTAVALDASTIGAVEGLGLTPAAIAPGTLNASAPSASFPIVGPSRHGLIYHVGGLSFSTATTTLSLRDYVINTTTGVLTAFASVNGSAVGRINLFDLGAAPAQAGCAATASLSLDSAAAGALTKVFNAPDLTGANFGVACVVPALYN